jgi:lysyl-tRNA synthetase class 2
VPATGEISSHVPHRTTATQLRLELMPSRVIRSFGYDADSRRLFIVFQTGRRYTYEDVPVETYEAMKGSFSKGEFFNAHIRNNFSFVRESVRT